MKWIKWLFKCKLRGIHKKRVSDGVCVRCGATSRK